MKADVLLSEFTTVIGVCGKDIEDIKNNVQSKYGLSDYGRSKLKIINIREN